MMGPTVLQTVDGTTIEGPGSSSSASPEKEQKELSGHYKNAKKQA